MFRADYATQCLSAFIVLGGFIVSKYQKNFIAVILLTVAAGLICWFKPLVKGLDIDGGMRVVMQVDPKHKGDWPTDTREQLEKMQTIKKTIITRVQGIQGVAEPIVAIQGNNRIVIELPGVKDTESALKRIKNTASLEFYYLKDVITQNNPTGEWDMKDDLGDEKGYTFVGSQGDTINSLTQPEELLKKVVKSDINPPILTGKDVLPNAKSNINQSNEKVINIEFNQSGTDIFRDFTRKHVGDRLAIFFDGKLLTAPSINEPIPNGQAVVSGFRSLKQARQTAEYLNSGALPIPMKIMTRDTVEPTLGKETVNQVVLAGILGIFLVILFMAIYYKLPGIIACIALGLYTLFVIASFKLLGATMSLAGVAALIISIGMAVDANILIFERLKEELRNGKTLRASIDAGFSRAFTAIFDSNMCTAITCVILMWLGSPAVKSFATTLLVGVIISMFTAITVTRTILHMLVNMEWAQKPSLYGLARSWTAGTHAKWDIVGKRKYYFILSAVLIVPGLIALGMFGLKPGIEFKSGTSIQATFEKPVTLIDVKDIVKETSKENEVQLSKVDGETKVAFIKTLPLSPESEKVLLLALNSKLGIATKNDANEPRFDAVSNIEPTISNELTQKSNPCCSVCIYCDHTLPNR